MNRTDEPHNDGTKTLEEWAAAKGTPDWLAAATRVRGESTEGGAWTSWGLGKRLSEQEFDAAVKAVAELPIGQLPNTDDEPASDAASKE